MVGNWIFEVLASDSEVDEDFIQIKDVWVDSKQGFPDEHFDTNNYVSIVLYDNVVIVSVSVVLDGNQEAIVDILVFQELMDDVFASKPLVVDIKRTQDIKMDDLGKGTSADVCKDSLVAPENPV